MARRLIADPVHEGVQLLATDDGADAGFATLFWSWETTTSRRIGVMNDLFVTPASRGRGVSSALIQRLPGTLPGARGDPDGVADGGRQP